jgi:DNA-binding MarR family transcriptional regulator
MNILKLQQKISAFLESIGRDRNQSPSINQMTIILLIYREGPLSMMEISDKLGKTYSAGRKLCYSLIDGTGRYRSGFQFLEQVPIAKRISHEDPRKRLHLTENGRKFAKILARGFKD